MEVAIKFTVDQDQVLSMQFGDALKANISKTNENFLCSIFWDGDFHCKLIETFTDPDSNESNDVEFKGTIFAGKLLLTDVIVGKWHLDPNFIAEKLNHKDII